jgi:hypothetical protein
MKKLFLLIVLAFTLSANAQITFEDVEIPSHQLNLVSNIVDHLTYDYMGFEVYKDYAYFTFSYSIPDRDIRKQVRDFIIKNYTLNNDWEVYESSIFIDFIINGKLMSISQSPTLKMILIQTEYKIK